MNVERLSTEDAERCAEEIAAIIAKTTTAGAGDKQNERAGFLLFRTPASRIQEQIKNPDNTFLVVRGEDKKIAGFVHLAKYPAPVDGTRVKDGHATQTLMVEKVAADPCSGQKGMMRALYESAQVIAKKEGLCLGAYVATHPQTNLASLKAHAALGFKVSGDYGGKGTEFMGRENYGSVYLTAPDGLSAGNRTSDEKAGQWGEFSADLRATPTFQEAPYATEPKDRTALKSLMGASAVSPAVTREEPAPLRGAGFATSTPVKAPSLGKV